MAIVGSAEVTIHADVSGLAKDIERQLGRIDTRGIGNTLGERIGAGIREGIESSIGRAIDTVDAMASDFELSGMVAGDAFGKGFLSEAKGHLDKLSTLLDPDSIGRDLARGMNAGFASNLGVEEVLNDQVQNGADRAESVGLDLGDRLARGVSVGMERNPIDFNFGGAGRDGGDAFGSSFRNAFDGWMSNRTSAPFEEMIKGLLGNIVQLQVMQGIIVGVVGAVSSLVSAFVALTSSVLAAVPALLKFGNVLSALGQGMIVASSLFKGIGEAVSAYTNVQQKAAQATKSSSATSQKALMSEEERLLRIREARDALNDAIIEGARSNKDAVEKVSDAHESLRDAIEGVSDAEESLRDAVEGVSDAETNLADAIRNEQRALESIDDARAKAQERIEDLQMALERGSLTEERAALNLKKAEQKLAQARAGGNANAIYEADLAYREQAQSLTEVRERNGDLRKESNKAQKDGVDGARAVLDAQLAYLRAVERSADAQEAVSDSIEKVSDAQEGVRDSTEKVSDAQRALKRAIEDVPRTAEDASIRIARAQLNLKKAIEDTGKSAVPAATALDAATQKMETAFDKLSPAAQDFVRYWADEVMPVFDRIKKAGQDVFFPNLQKAIENIIDNSDFMDMIETAFVDTSRVLGEFALNLSKAFTTPETMKALDTILKSNVKILENIGKAAVNLVEPLSQIFAATAPLAEAWSLSMVDATEKFKDFIGEQAKAPEGEDSPLVKFFAGAQKRLSDLWAVLKNVGSGLIEVFEIALPAGDKFLGFLKTTSGEWKKSFEDPKKRESMAATFAGAEDNAESLIKMITALGGAFFRIGANENIGDIADAIKEVIPVFESLANDALDQIGPAIVKIIKAIPKFGKFFTETGTIKTFVDIISSVVEKLGDFLEYLSQFKGAISIAGKILGTVLALKLFFGLFGAGVKKVQGVIDNIKNFGGAIAGAGKKAGNALANIGNFFNKIREGNKAAKDAEKDAASRGWGKDVQKAEGKAARKTAKIAVQADFDDAQVRREADKMNKAFDKSVDGGKLKKAGKAAGKAVVDGFEWGLEGGFDDTFKAAVRLGKRAIAGLQSAIKAKSPSLEAKQEGTHFWQGFVKGLDSGKAAASDAGDDLGDAAVRGLKGDESKFTREGKRDKAAYARGLGGPVSGPTALGGGGLGGKGGKGGKGRLAAGLADDVGDVAKSSGKLGKVGGLLSKAFGPVGKIFGKLGLKALGKGFLLILGPIGAVIGAVWTVIDVLSMFGIGMDDILNFFKNFGTEAPKMWGKVTEAFSKAWDKVKEIGGKIGDWLGNLGTTIKEKVSGWWDGMVEALPGVIDAVQNWFTTTFIPWLVSLPGKIIGLYIDVWGWILEKAWDLTKALGSWLAESFIPWLVGIPGKILNLNIAIWGWILDKAADLMVALGKWVIEKLLPWIAELPGKMKAAAGNVFGFIKDKAIDGWEALKTWWSETVLPWLKQRPENFKNNVGNVFGFIKDKAIDGWEALKTWWSETVLPWLKQRPENFKNNVGNVFGFLKDKAVDGFDALKTFFTETVMPWVKGIPKRFSDGMVGLWDGFKTGAAKASNWVIDKVNQYIIPALNTLPFVKLKELGSIPIPGQAEGGFVTGPDRGPKADNVLRRLTPGEYVLTRKMANQMGGSALEQWRRGGKMPEGGLGDWIGKATDFVGSLIPDKIDKWLMQGATFALERVIREGLSNMPDTYGMVGVLEKYLNANLSLLRAYGKTIDDKINKRNAGESGSSVEPYDGPAGGWTYPLARRFESYTRAKHKPSWAYDIGSPVGIGVRSVSSGRVSGSYNKGNTSYGQYLTVVHADGTESLYAHLSKRMVSAGQIVKTGQMIGISGATGGVTGPHLHFELGSEDARRMLKRRGVTLASGGTVRATPGGVMALLAEGGRHERVTPLDSQGRSATEVEMLKILKDMAVSGRGGDTFQIFPAPGMSERELAVKVSREVAFRHRRRA